LTNSDIDKKKSARLYTTQYTTQEETQEITYIDIKVEEYLNKIIRQEVTKLCKRTTNVINGVFNWYHTNTPIDIKYSIDFKKHETGVEVHVYAYIDPEYIAKLREKIKQQIIQQHFF